MVVKVWKGVEDEIVVIRSESGRVFLIVFLDETVFHSPTRLHPA
jgi:hypothetical protein